MARANRHYIPGHVWHITHRCHKQDFLLKFGEDRKRWVDWLFEAKKRFKLSVLNYMVTSNHIHLLVYNNNGPDVIPKSIQLIAARTAQEYNNRKRRKGAFWEDRYHATVVERNTHLIRCLVYIDLNMFRAGVVDHPKMWPFGGYNEIQNPPCRYRIIDLKNLVRLTGFTDLHDLQKAHKKWIEASLKAGASEREAFWSESIAVGSKPFIKKVKTSLGFKVKGRSIKSGQDNFQLREKVAEFRNAFSDVELSTEGVGSEALNALYWDENL